MAFVLVRMFQTGPQFRLPGDDRITLRLTPQSHLLGEAVPHPRRGFLSVGGSPTPSTRTGSPLARHLTSRSRTRQSAGSHTSTAASASPVGVIRTVQELLGHRSVETT